LRSSERRALEQAIGALPEVFRTVFVLRVVEGISGIETAASLGVHETTVRTRLYRAHRRMEAETVHRVRAAPLLLDLSPARLERLVSRVLRPRSGPSPLAEAIAEMKAAARAAGLTDADIDAELAAYNAERCDRRTAD